MVWAFWLPALAGCLLGCHQTMLIRTPRQLPSESVQEVSWSSHFFFGYVGGRQLDLRDYCRNSAVERIELSSSAATLALTVVTLGVYFPRRVTVTCLGDVEQ